MASAMDQDIDDSKLLESEYSGSEVDDAILESDDESETEDNKSENNTNSSNNKESNKMSGDGTEKKDGDCALKTSDDDDCDKKSAVDQQDNEKSAVDQQDNEKSAVDQQDNKKSAVDRQDNEKSAVDQSDLEHENPRIAKKRKMAYETPVEPFSGEYEGEEDMMRQMGLPMTFISTKREEDVRDPSKPPKKTKRGGKKKKKRIEYQPQPQLQPRVYSEHKSFYIPKKYTKS
ncbi:uncharacterized protein LOC144445689 [Glandiceps talaboti]